MARIFITGSSTGIGLKTGELLVAQGHAVVLHARNPARAEDTRRALPKAEAVVLGDLASMTETRSLAEQVNKLGRFDAVIHNAGIGPQEGNAKTREGISNVFAVNVIAPYILTALITKPDRLVYLSSSMHRSASANMDDLTWSKRTWSGAQAYSESKLYNVMIAFGIARRWPAVLSNAVDPGWVATRMGGASAPSSLEEGSETQAWLAVSNDAKARVTGKYFNHMNTSSLNPDASKRELQDKLLAECERLSGVKLPA